MVKKKKTTIRGRAAKAKGSRAERKVRDALRRIYPPEYRDRVQRVPMSGAGWMKGDVFDGNDPDSAYEVKCQETLCIPDWWRQAKSQAGATRTPVLVITQAYRPFYYILTEEAWNAMLNASDFAQIALCRQGKRASNLMDRLSTLQEREVLKIAPAEDECVVVPEAFYLEVKASLFKSKMVK